MSRTIGVFDSGIGGLSVAQAIQAAMPGARIIFKNDQEHVPYGTKSPDEIFGYVLPILKELENEGSEAIVVACNTVSTTLIERLRPEFTIPLIAMEPMVKPAAEQTKSGVVAVCATPTTLASDRYKWLKDTYASGVKVVEPDCSDWAYMIEKNQINSESIRSRIEDALAQQADVIVLGCTHYHWIEDLINTIVAGRAAVIQPEQPVIKQLERVLSNKS